MKNRSTRTLTDRRTRYAAELAEAAPGLARFGRDVRLVGGYFWACFHQHWSAVLGLLVLLNLLVLFVLRPLEASFNPALRAWLSGEEWSRASEWISWSGEYLFLLVVFGSLLVLSRLRESRRLQILAACILLSVLAASVTARVGKFCFGRVRPIVAERLEIPDTFHGPTLNSKYHSYPSGHTAAAFAAAAPLQMTYPIAGLPATLYATAIAGSRSLNNQHYLSDLLAGFALALIIARPTRWLFQELKRIES